MLVTDSSTVLRALGLDDPFAWAGTHRLLAPPLLWSEVTSAIHEAAWRRELTPANADALRSSFAANPVEAERWPGLHAAAWDVAQELGWAKTYDAEFVALARHHGCLLVTTDRRLRRGADRLGFVRTPSEILGPEAGS